MSAQADQGESIVGRLFVEYWEDNHKDPYAHIPAVEVSVKVYELSKVFAKENSFHAKFCLQLDWEDESLPPQGEPVNFEDHFIPRFEIDNPGEEIPEAEKGRMIRRKPIDGHPCRVTMTERYVGELLSRVDVSDFPYDIQLLQLDIKSRPYHNKEQDKKNIQLSDPVTFRREEGARLVAAALPRIVCLRACVCARLRRLCCCCCCVWSISASAPMVPSWRASCCSGRCTDLLIGCVVCMCVYARVRACVCACVRVCARARVCAGHSINAGANWNPQWHLVGITGGNWGRLAEHPDDNESAKEERNKKQLSKKKKAGPPDFVCLPLLRCYGSIRSLVHSLIH